MTSLKDTSAFRGPANSPNTGLGGWIGHVHLRKMDSICLDVKLSAGGRGKTKVSIRIGKGDFETILTSMVEVDRGTTLLAIASTLGKITDGLSKEEKDDIKARLAHSKPWYKRI